MAGSRILRWCQPEEGARMDDDVFCVFILFACMLTLLMPGPGQVIVAVFSFSLAVVAVCTKDAGDTESPGRNGHGGPATGAPTDVNHQA
jgi:hypothetical protein